MFDKDIALEALGALLNGTVTSHQKQGSLGQPEVPGAGGAVHKPLLIEHFITKLFHAHEASHVTAGDILNTQHHIIDEEEFFVPSLDFNFTNIKDARTFFRGGEEYERPYGWYRYALKVLDKYGENIWLGSMHRSTQSEPREWPVSYHGTSREGAVGIIEEGYKPGERERYGRGIYSTPHIKQTKPYRKKFTSNKTGKKYEVVLQNRINPEYREICKTPYPNQNYWLIPIPAEKEKTEVHEIVVKSIRPYGLLVREVTNLICEA